ncbi:hypothetical protein BDA96_01G433300 [Sorghum bicolor]|uniref:Uncharacterized protein n=1 Tax=Sorghum bicolor TaxID=4558 RepID=A0A921V1R3_SORBI|nr:hypothetical protein BDA96_01G433300 [Sorghum bicolor]
MESLVIQEGSSTPSTSSGIDLHTILSDKEYKLSLGSCVAVGNKQKDKLQTMCQ